MQKKKKVLIILAEIEYYLSFDVLQRKYAEKGINNALVKIQQEENKKK